MDLAFGDGDNEMAGSQSDKWTLFDVELEKMYSPAVMSAIESSEDIYLVNYLDRYLLK